MKTRSGFVSNSSSSSFLIVGIDAGSEEACERFGTRTQFGFDYPDGMIHPYDTNIVGFGTKFDEYGYETFLHSYIGELTEKAHEKFGPLADIRIFVGKEHN